MDYWKKGLEFPFLAIFTRIMAELSLIWDYVCLIWFKVVLKNSDYQKYHKFPYEIKEIDLGLKTKMQEDFGGTAGFIQVGQNKWILPSAFRKYAEDVYNLQTRKSDIFVVSYPRSGTTWTQEIVWMIANNLDYKGAKYRPLSRRFPFLDLHWFISDQLKNELKGEIKDNESWKHRLLTFMLSPLERKIRFWIFTRFVKTHLPIQLLPRNINESGAKIVYVARNPKDMICSFYHLSKMWTSMRYNKDFETFFDYFQKDVLYWSPYFTHLKDAWSRRHQQNVLFLFYEDMQKDLIATINIVAEFLEKPVSPADVPKLLEHLSIESFRNNDSLNMCEGHELGILRNYSEGCSFIRNGKNGEYTEKFTPELAAKADLWISENLKDTDLRFPS